MLSYLREVQTMRKEILHKELQFKAVRSSGAGGQHVNKVSSKVELFFAVETSDGLSEEEKELLFKNLASKLTKENSLVLSCQESRSQHRNKELVVERFFNLIDKNLIVPKVRRKTKPSKLARKKRLDAKKRLSEKKNNRKKIDF